MILHPTPIAGAWLIELDRRRDARGSFARLWSVADLRRHGLAADFVEVNTSVTAQRGTLRGLHWQESPHEEAKLLRCTRGAIYDVIVDLRAHSPSQYTWAGFELSAQGDQLLYIPAGCAHGIQTLVDDTEIVYGVSACYQPGAERGVRWNDPALAITWPIVPPIVSDKDARWPDLIQSNAPVATNCI